ncbi:MAG: tetratricopeptide repeat protein [Pseudorhodoplanes sp.]
MRTRHASIAASLIWLSSHVSPLAAQNLDQQIAQCSSVGAQPAPSARVTACTALIRSGRLDPLALAQARHNRGNAYRAQRAFARAIADYDEALRLSPENAMAYADRGVAYANQGDHRRAIVDYSEAIRLNPRDQGFYRLRALAHYQLGDRARSDADNAEATRLWVATLPR